MYDATKVDVSQKVAISGENLQITEILDRVFQKTGITYEINNRQIALNSMRSPFPAAQTSQTVKGKVTDASGFALPGVTVVIRSSTQGTITNTDGNYSLSNVTSKKGSGKFIIE